MSGQNMFTNIQHTYSTELPVGPGSVNNLGVMESKLILPNLNSLEPLTTQFVVLV